MIWIELSAEAEAEAADAVSELLTEVGQGGIAIEPALSEQEPGRVELDPTRPVTIKTYIPADDRSEKKIRRAEEALWHLSQMRHVGPLRVTRLAEEDWAEAWKKFFFVQRMGERLVVKPSWREYQPGPREVVLELDPGMAFGTGLHPTTRMCLVACERLVERGMRVLDVGTGSGILAIAAAKLGADEVLALDVDPVAVEVATKNVALNGLADRIRVLHGSVGLVVAGPGRREQTPIPGPSPHGGEGRRTAGPGGGLGCPQDPRPEAGPGRSAWRGLGCPQESSNPCFDLVLANIIASVIVELAGGLYEATAPGGLVVASGIIMEHEESARGALEEAGFQVREVVAEGDWRTVVGQRGRA